MRDFSSAGIDYYGVLEIEKHASDREIKESYRRLALKYHPVRNRDHFEKEPQRFQQLCEAYDVLSSSLYRTIYDQYGEAGLKRGVPRPEGGFYDPYVYCGEPEETFREFFGTNSPYADIIDNIKKPLSHYQGDDGTCQRKKAPDLVTPLVLSLQELYTGCLKKVRVSRRVLDDSGTNTTLCEKILTLHIEPGWPAGKTITFREEGDQGPNIIPGDLVFVLEDAAHAQFERDGHDLVYLMRVPLVHALTGCSVDVETLDGRLLHVSVHDVVFPGFKKVVRGEGMPVPGPPPLPTGGRPPPPGRRHPHGDLIIKFEVDFPRRLTQMQRHALRAILLAGPK
ncbi:dnaJ homolog subfamily B member 13-like [Pollicipes pollicipes]|uniref:dnaJ homolog subfamily B member 13-like n=1 Tax=Pollicipes pollicipes TaxID=41117 RepID=UPI00188494E8|nr:dnaJ homolog subfamily B member 13-like [Pollicipes pollicipes]